MINLDDVIKENIKEHNANWPQVSYLSYRILIIGDWSIEYSNDMDDIHKNIEEYDPNKKRKLLIVFDAMILDVLSNKKLCPIVTELFIRERKLNISLVFISKSYFAAPEKY